MPLHDWTDDRGWDGVHLMWISELARWLQTHLPEGYRAYVGSVPALSVESNGGRPDVAVRRWRPEPPDPRETSADQAPTLQPDFQGVAVLTVDPDRAVHINWHGKRVAALELVSPGNKDRPERITRYLRRYRSYLEEGTNLGLVDVHRRPVDFSFADALAQTMQFPLPPCPTPHAVSWHVGGSLPGEETIRCFLDGWRRTLTVGQPLPSLPLPLSDGLAIEVNLEDTYARAAAAVYLD